MMFAKLTGIIVALIGMTGIVNADNPTSVPVCVNGQSAYCCMLPKSVITRGSGWPTDDLGAYQVILPVVGTIVGGANCLDWDYTEWCVPHHPPLLSRESNRFLA